MADLSSDATTVVAWLESAEALYVLGRTAVMEAERAESELKLRHFNSHWLCEGAGERRWDRQAKFSKGWHFTETIRVQQAHNHGQKGMLNFREGCTGPARAKGSDRAVTQRQTVISSKS